MTESSRNRNTPSTMTDTLESIHTRVQKGITDELFQFISKYSNVESCNSPKISKGKTTSSIKTSTPQDTNTNQDVGQTHDEVDVVQEGTRKETAEEEFRRHKIRLFEYAMQ